jgi:uncharacterized membrane protein YhaH (DUF805 family)
MGFPHQFDPEHSGFTAPGLLSSPFAGSCIATDPPTIFGHRRNPAEAVPVATSLLSSLLFSLWPLPVLTLRRFRDVGHEFGRARVPVPW